MIASPMPFPGMPYKKDARIQQSRLAFARTSRFLLIFYFIFAISQAILLAALALL